MPHPINHPVLSILVHKCLSSMCCLSIPSITSEVPSPSPCAPAIECLPFPFSHSTLHPSPRVIFPKTGSIMSSPCLQYSIAECYGIPSAVSFPGGSAIKNLSSMVKCRRLGFNTWVGKIPYSFGIAWWLRQ